MSHGWTCPQHNSTLEKDLSPPYWGVNFVTLKKSFISNSKEMRQQHLSWGGLEWQLNLKNQAVNYQRRKEHPQRVPWEYVKQVQGSWNTTEQHKWSYYRVIPSPIATHTMSIILLQFTSFMWWCRKNLMPWNTLKITSETARKHTPLFMRWCFYNKTMELYICIHACMCIHTIAWNKSCLYFFSFILSKFIQHQLCTSNLKYSSEHDVVYTLAPRQPISSTILMYYWNKYSDRGLVLRQD